MRVEKQKEKVMIICNDGSMIKGFVHINPGERLLDFLNDEKENFVAVTSVEFQNVATVHSFKIYSELSKKRNSIVLNKSVIRWMEEA